MPADIVSIVRRCFEAYVANDRAAIEALIAEQFSFSSPLDNAIDRQTYFAVCWPNSQMIANFEFVHLAAADDQVFATYVGTASDGRRFRNTEVHTVRDGKIAIVEVYFGWSLPHEAPQGEHIDPPAKAG